MNRLQRSQFTCSRVRYHRAAREYLDAAPPGRLRTRLGEATCERVQRTCFSGRCSPRFQRRLRHDALESSSNSLIRRVQSFATETSEPTDKRGKILGNSQSGRSAAW
jgi:hypothetical protein